MIMRGVRQKADPSSTGPSLGAGQFTKYRQTQRLPVPPATTTAAISAPICGNVHAVMLCALRVLPHQDEGTNTHIHQTFIGLITFLQDCKRAEREDVRRSRKARAGRDRYSQHRGGTLRSLRG
jgi:hypothetical protein